ncbi:MAG: hypothetical protein P8M80_00260 [Pirellulaceae bacterium]|nr:hypothetical protein [Pirellulaceae bacterium]
MRDSRRRRMMFRDESHVAEAASSVAIHPATDSAHNSPNEYMSGALIQNQPRLVDYVPTRVFTLMGIILMLASIIALLNFAHFQMLPMAIANGSQASSLDLAFNHGLATWVSSILLLATAFFCFQVFQIRRYRADDFSGSYRIWIWLAAGFVLASLDSATQISVVIAELLASYWENGVLSEYRTVWMLIVGIPASIACIRLILELWRSRIAIGSIAFATLSFTLGNILRMDFFQSIDSTPRVLESNSFLASHCFIFLAIISYSRFVLLESQVVSGEMTEEQSKASSAAIQSKARKTMPPMVQHSDATEYHASQRGLENASPITLASSIENPRETPSLANSNQEESSSESNQLEMMGQVIHKIPTKKKKKRNGRQNNASRRAA